MQWLALFLIMPWRKVWLVNSAYTRNTNFLTNRSKAQRKKYTTHRACRSKKSVTTYFWVCTSCLAKPLLLKYSLSRYNTRVPRLPQRGNLRPWYWNVCGGCKQMSADPEADIWPGIYFNRKLWKMLEVFWICLHINNCIFHGGSSDSCRWRKESPICLISKAKQINLSVPKEISYQPAML